MLADRAAAFARLCVETTQRLSERTKRKQPPSRGCVLKLFRIDIASAGFSQPPSRGCVLKQTKDTDGLIRYDRQPPSRGCVLKPAGSYLNEPPQPQPPSRGCVLKPLVLSAIITVQPRSRLRAAVC